LSKPSAQLREIPFAAQHKQMEFQAKDLTGELFDPQYLNLQGRISPGSKGEPNGLESA
jgi:hypothetical protein